MKIYEFDGIRECNAFPVKPMTLSFQERKPRGNPNEILSLSPAGKSGNSDFLIVAVLEFPCKRYPQKVSRSRPGQVASQGFCHFSLEWKPNTPGCVCMNYSHIDYIIPYFIAGIWSNQELP